MNEFEKAAMRVFTLIMIGLGIILWLQLQGCTPTSLNKEIEHIDEIKIDSSLA